MDGSIKSDVGVISINPNTINVEAEKLQSSQLDESIINEISKPENPSGIQQKSLNKTLNTIKNLLIPTILSLLAGFGISNALSYVKGETSNLNPSCPTPKSILLFWYYNKKMAHFIQ